MALFTVTDYDRRVYDEELRDFLPDQLIDMHTHVWRKADHLPSGEENAEPRRTVLWPDLVAADNPIEDLQETYRLMFPGKNVTPLIFSDCGDARDLPSHNAYIERCARDTGYPALYFTRPEQTPDEIERAIRAGGYFGVKSYLSLSPAYIPEKEIRIFDFFPPAQLERLSRMQAVVMLHIPRDGRLRDPVNIAQILEIKQRFPGVKLIIAHIGRAYCPCDIGSAFEQLAPAKDLLFDLTANTSTEAMTALIRAVGPERILFGSDLPILRMRMRRIVENDRYINLIPPGLYGDPAQDSHLREVSPEEGEKLTFFMYEEIRAFKKAAQATGLTREDVRKVFFENAQRILRSVPFVPGADKRDFSIQGGVATHG